MSSSFLPRASILEISPYVPGKSTAKGVDNVIKLSSNETPLGPSPKAIKAFEQTQNQLFRYPDGGASQLRGAIAQVYGLNPDHLICGAGSDEILNLIAQSYLKTGDEAIYTEHGFLVYKIAILAAGARPVVAPEIELTANVDEILKMVSDKTKLVFIANPNNPTGTYLPADEVRRLRRELPAHIGLVLDGAYAEYVTADDYEAGLELVATSDNTIMTRTFSKIYGLASLRIGWAFASTQVIDVLNRIRGPFNVSAAAIEAGAAAIQDHDFTQRAVAHNERWLKWVSEQLTAIGLQVTPSVANFILVHFEPDGPRSASAADEFLLQQGIVVRAMEAYGLPHALRITIGKQNENEAVVAALTRFLEGA